MKVSRRGFLKLSSLAALTLKTGFAWAGPPKFKLVETKETTTICPYCAVGCGIIVHSRNGKFIESEGDPDHVINQGKLCSKGKALTFLSYDYNKNRLTKPLYRAPYSDKWEEKSWDWVIKEIAKRVKTTRDKYFITHNKKGQRVNRVEAIASIGSAALDNEECYLIQKLMRGLGLVYIEHQARI